jgi:hypothetical protein
MYVFPLNIDRTLLAVKRALAVGPIRDTFELFDDDAAEALVPAFCDAYTPRVPGVAWHAVWTARAVP